MQFLTLTLNIIKTKIIREKKCNESRNREKLKQFRKKIICNIIEHQICTRNFNSSLNLAQSNDAEIILLFIWSWWNKKPKYSIVNCNYILFLIFISRFVYWILGKPITIFHLFVCLFFFCLNLYAYVHFDAIYFNVCRLSFHPVHKF